MNTTPIVQDYRVERRKWWNDRIQCNITRIRYTQEGSDFLKRYSTYDPYDHSQSSKIVIGPFRMYLVWNSRMMIFQIKRSLSLLHIEVTKSRG